MSVRTMIRACVPNRLRPIVQNIDASPMASRMARGAFWSLAGAVISRGLGLVASILVARFLGRESFGELGIVQSTVGMFGVLAGFGTSVTATKYVAEYRASDPARAGRIMALSSAAAWTFGTVTMAPLILAAPWLAERTLNAPHLAGLLRIGSLLLLLGAVNGAQLGALAGFEAFKRMAQVNLAAGLLSFPFMALGAYFWKLEGAVWGLVAAQAANCVLSHWALRQETRGAGVPLRFAGCLQEARVLWMMSLPATLGSTVIYVSNWAAYTMLVNSTDGYGGMGVLNASNQWRNALAVMPSIFLSAVVPILSSYNQQPEGQQQQWKGLEASHLLASLGVWPIAVLLAFVSQAILAAYGSDFADGNAIFVFCLASTAVNQGGAAVSTLMSAKGWLWLGFGCNVFSSLTVLLATCLLIADFGALAVAAASYASQLLTFAWLLPLMQARRYLPAGFAVRVLAGMGATSLLMILSLYFEPRVALLAAFPAALVAVLVWYLSSATTMRKRVIQVTALSPNLKT